MEAAFRMVVFRSPAKTWKILRSKKERCQVIEEVGVYHESPKLVRTAFYAFKKVLLGSLEG